MLRASEVQGMKADLRIYASMSCEMPSEKQSEYQVSSLGTSNIIQMTITPKSNASLFTQKSLYVGLYSMTELNNFGFIFGFGPNK